MPFQLPLFCQYLYLNDHNFSSWCHDFLWGNNKGSYSECQLGIGKFGLLWLGFKRKRETNNYWPSSVMQTLGWDIPEIWSHFSLIRSCKGRIILFLFYKRKKWAELRLKEIIWPNSRMWFSWDSNTGFPDSVSIFFPLKELKWNSLHIVGELGMLLSTKKKKKKVWHNLFLYLA